MERHGAKKQTREQRWRGGNIAEAKAFLLQKLAKGPRPAEEITRQAKAKGISARTLKRARQLLGVKSAKSKKSFRGGWMWSL